MAFNAKDDEVVDFLDIKRSEIVSIDIVEPLEIEKLW